MKDHEFIRQLHLKLQGNAARIKDLELENAELKRQLDCNIVALGKADAKLAELNKK